MGSAITGSVGRIPFRRKNETKKALVVESTAIGDQAGHEHVVSREWGAWGPRKRSLRLIPTKVAHGETRRPPDFTKDGKIKCTYSIEHYIAHGERPYCGMKPSMRKSRNTDSDPGKILVSPGEALPYRNTGPVIYTAFLLVPAEEEVKYALAFLKYQTKRSS
ncbi:uncharacterized protein BDW43DRAFT_259902 [Aspergillus alliaceus]|uniref:uncharacterized protein n=1 Tax=Petromyces alliaceus TaxID=209559 RepID=UPI0012A6A19E|nr:uncharacterized protein BDW43DRAFT_259902 [Aspergillus alliaceus]KAB8238839.1 hypothetical protein BDW43DRAFT_259902 [Aspergillus alliaceus]